MHYSYFVRLSKDEANTSKEARLRVYNLLEDEGFTNQGHFGAGKADWFVIGGRWSGQLQNLLLKKDFHDVAKNIVKAKHDFITNDDVKKHATELQKAWESIGGKGKHIWYRSSHESYGYDDDAMIITAPLLRALKNRYGKPDDFGDSVECYDSVLYTEINVSDLPKESIGDWLVIVDYHN